MPISPISGSGGFHGKEPGSLPPSDNVPPSLANDKLSSISPQQRKDINKLASLVEGLLSPGTTPRAQFEASAQNALNALNQLMPNLPPGLQAAGQSLAPQIQSFLNNEGPGSAIAVSLEAIPFLVVAEESLS